MHPPINTDRKSIVSNGDLALKKDKDTQAVELPIDKPRQMNLT